MTIDVASFRIRYPEFTEALLGDTRVDLFLEDAQCSLSRTKLPNTPCGERTYERMIFALAAHLARLNLNSSSGVTASSGIVASKSVGKVSVSYNRRAASSSQEEYYAQTIYGQTYLSLFYQNCAGFMSVC